MGRAEPQQRNIDRLEGAERVFAQVQRVLPSKYRSKAPLVERHQILVVCAWLGIYEGPRSARPARLEDPCQSVPGCRRVRHGGGWNRRSRFSGCRTKPFLVRADSTPESTPQPSEPDRPRRNKLGSRTVPVPGWEAPGEDLVIMGQVEGFGCAPFEGGTPPEPALQCETCRAVLPDPTKEEGAAAPRIDNRRHKLPCVRGPELLDGELNQLNESCQGSPARTISRNADELETPEAIVGEVLKCR